MFKRLLIAGMVLALTTVALGADKDAEKKAREALDKKLAELKAGEGDLKAITDDALSASFPKYTFFVLRYPQFPVARVPAEPLKSNNLFIVDADGKVEHLTDSKGLEKFFMANLGAPKKDGADALKSWLRLTQEFQQDGFYKFKFDKDSVKGVGTDDIPQSKLVVSGRGVVEPEGGNKGEIAASLSFTKGKLAEVKEEVKLVRGMRPRCQATKLLDDDPIVRYMAEESIVIMGRAVKPYLDEQRAKARPELQKAIDRVWKRILDEDR